jgi:hypothetical protein
MDTISSFFGLDPLLKEEIDNINYIVSTYKHSNSVPGAFPGWKSEDFTDEHKNNMSIAASKRIRTPEHLAALHQGRRNSKNSDEHNAAVSRIGSKHTAEAKDKMSIAKVKLGKEYNIKIASNAGKISAQKRKESGYYQTNEAKLRYAKMWETRRSRKEGFVDGN